jgi:site-specific recombinase XerD
MYGTLLAENLVEHSLSENTWNIYANAEKSFEKFRKHYDLEKVWPVPISHLINFIVYLAKNSYSPNTAKSYIAAIGFKMKMNNLTDIYSQKIIERYV